MRHSSWVSSIGQTYFSSPAASNERQAHFSSTPAHRGIVVGLHTHSHNVQATSVTHGGSRQSQATIRTVFGLPAPQQPTNSACSTTAFSFLYK